MRRPARALVGAVLCTLVAVGSVAAAPDEPAEAKGWTHPRMSWGAPDLQGTWTNATITGLERPDELEDLVLTPDRSTGFRKASCRLAATSGATTASGSIPASDSRGYAARSAAR